jgi:hypothetical protein
VDHADGSAVARRDREQMIGRAHAAAAHHVLHHDRRIARNVLAHVAGERTRINVVAAAGVGGDHEIDGLTLVEIRDLVGGGCTP